MSTTRMIPHPFDMHGVDRVTLRELLDGLEEMTDHEVVEALLERPAAGLASFMTEREARAVLRVAVKDERQLMALGDAIGPAVDPRYLSRTTSGRAELSEFFRQCDQLVEQTEDLASRAGDLRDRLRDRMGYDPTDDDPTRELRPLVHDLQRAWANARRIRWAMRNTPGGLPLWDRDDEGEEWKGEE